uniref:Palmitoyl-protein thioesterase 2 n=1 Tax=Nomascus leucogenys TaxID=61853 RepID=A0A2I3HQU8_NOMLE
MLGLWGQRLPAVWVLLLLPFLPLLLLAAPAPHRASYKPVIVVHGLFDSSYSFRHLLEYINEGALCAGLCFLSWMITMWILSSLSPLHRWDSMETRTT